jgi:hypothetical protein
MTDVQPHTIAPTYQDRSTWLIVLGVVQVLIGLCVAGMTLLLTIEMAFVPAMKDVMNWRTMTPVLFPYVALAVALVWLGIGSCLARRWAHALTLVLSWMALVMGMFAMVTMIATAGQLRQTLLAQQTMSAEMATAIQVITLAMMLAIYVLLPGVFVLFYQGKNVWATCQAKDPKRRWTDETPLPVLAMSLFLGFGAAFMPITAFCHFAVPLFGVLLHGILGGLVCLTIAIVNVILAYQLYKLRPAAWWVALIVLGLLSCSATITFARIDLIDLYKHMDMPAKQLEQMRQMAPTMKAIMPWATAVSSCAWVGYMLWIRRYFVAKEME